MEKTLVKILLLVLSQASPALLQMLKKFANEFVAKAKSTENPWDDILAYGLKLIADLIPE